MSHQHQIDRVAAAPLSLPVRVGLRAKHTVRLTREVLRHGADHGMWWLIPMFIVMLILVASVATATSAVPVAVYTLF